MKKIVLGASIIFSMIVNAQNGILGNGVTDIDGNKYQSVIIGTQEWMKENLKVSKYKDGTSIPNVKENSQWCNLTSGAYSYFNNDASHNVTYGKLYNWYAIDTKNICPTGWHVPSDADWSKLINFLGGEYRAIGKMTEPGKTHWERSVDQYQPSNSSLFTALPGSARNNEGCGFDSYIGRSGIWWSSSMRNSTNPATVEILLFESSIKYSAGSKSSGFSVRCLKD